nr:phosphatase PAP2 family protein [Motilibacter aurantiacus]
MWARLQAAGEASSAVANAHSLYAWERAVGLPDELALQKWLLDRPTLARTANTYYATVHFPFTGLVLAWLFLRDRVQFRWARTVLVAVTAAALVLTFTVPLAPPRLMPDLGFTDVAAVLGPSVYAHSASGATNQLAAMPSLHVGWAVLVAVALVRAGHTRWRWLWLVHPAVTWLVVVATANHYWADGLVAVAMLLAVMASASALRRERGTGP